MFATAIAWIAGSRLGRYAAFGFAVLLLLIGARAKWRHDGASDARQDMREADHERANAGREREDAARAADAADPRSDAEWLRDHGRLRD